jgi:ATP-dependent Clp protease adapter protein ClpS
MPIDAPVREATPTFTIQWLPPHMVVVHNNDHNDINEVILILMIAVPGMLRIDAICLTYEIHETGAAVVFCGDIEEAETCARKIRSIGIKVTVEPDA